MSKIGRNQPCPCGSGKKFKRCCLGKGAVSAQVTIPMHDGPCDERCGDGRMGFGVLRIHDQLAVLQAIELEPERFSVLGHLWVVRLNDEEAVSFHIEEDELIFGYVGTQNRERVGNRIIDIFSEKVLSWPDQQAA